MSLYNRILVPTDGSREGRRAVGHAVAVAEAHGATVIALYVINTASYNGIPMESSWKNVTTLLDTDAQAALDEVVDIGAERGVTVETEIIEGSPSREIIRAAEANDCDLIVMGTHGRGGLDRLLLGSVAEKVVRSAPIPVMTVRVGIEPADVGGPATAETNTNSEPMAADSRTS
jgi:nucleotide-binding universal stress UspA family protein